MKVLVFAAGAAGAGVAQVSDYIADANCKANYIRPSKPACVADGKCSPVGSEGCTEIDQWQWDNHAPGVNPAPRMRVTKNGDDKQKTVWAYAGDITQGEAMQVYDPKGKVTAEGVLNTPVNMVSFIANVLIDQPSEWFRPGHNNTDGCGQKQTWELPFGFEGNSTTALPAFHKNLKLLHENGVTCTMTMGSWCTSFPVNPEEEWSEDQFGEFVTYFQKIREETFGGYLDGIDFDWEGYCSQECLKGANACHCGWSDDVCGDKTPEELAAGVHWMVKGEKMECWRMATKSTLQVMTGITYHMKKAGFVVTLVPMSTQVYSGEEDSSSSKVLRNEIVQHRVQPYPGGKPIAGSEQVNILDLADAVLLQWYSGFDAALCHNVDDPKACSCDNVPDEDYPNVVTVKDGLLSTYWTENSTAGNMFPASFPVRCNACSGTEGPNKCASEDETWFRPCGNSTSCVEEHKAKLANYSEHHNHTEHWWVQGVSVDSKCPRGIDCPDWQYEGEPRYSRQMKLLGSLAKVVDLEKVSIGFETLGIDVQVQMAAYADPALPWTDVTPDQLQKEHIYYTQCVQNMTAENEKDEKRCAQPLLTQQWGLKFNASDMLGLDQEVQKQFGKSLNGVGFFTLDGVIAVPKGQTERYWRKALLELNTTWAHIPNHAVPMPTPPAPTPTGSGSCTKTAPSNACASCSTEKDCGNSDSGRTYCWASKDPQCKPAGAGYCVHSAPTNACGSCTTEKDCGNDSTQSMCWAAPDWQCPHEEVSVVV